MSIDLSPPAAGGYPSPPEAGYASIPGETSQCVQATANHRTIAHCGRSER
jgi:hypothetical protein